MSKQIVDFGPIADVVCRVVGPAAVPHPDIRPRRDNVEARVGQADKAGKVQFRFMHAENFLVEFEVDVVAFVRDPHGYLGGIVRDLSLVVENARRSRQAQTAIYLMPTSAEVH